LVILTVFWSGCAGKFTNLPPTPPTDPMIVKMLQGYDLLAKDWRGKHVRTEFYAKLYKFQNEGRVVAIRKTSLDGVVEYEQLETSGDDRARKQVVYRFMEQETNPSPERPDLSISPRNYEFTFLGDVSREGKDVHLIKVDPREKKVGLFRGYVWLDPASGFPIHEEGRLVKSPSIYFKEVRFVRKFEIKEDLPHLRQWKNSMQTRLFGQVDLEMTYSDPELPAAR
jgi:hypothetical protein